MLLIIMYIF